MIPNYILLHDIVKIILLLLIGKSDTYKLINEVIILFWI